MICSTGSAGGSCVMLPDSLCGFAAGAGGGAAGGGRGGGGRGSARGVEPGGQAAERLPREPAAVPAVGRRAQKPGRERPQSRQRLSAFAFCWWEIRICWPFLLPSLPLDIWCLDRGGGSA